jgi:hypothetical protein
MGRARVNLKEGKQHKNIRSQQNIKKTNPKSQDGIDKSFSNNGQ